MVRRVCILGGVAVQCERRGHWLAAKGIVAFQGSTPRYCFPSESRDHCQTTNMFHLDLSRIGLQSTLTEEQYIVVHLDSVGERLLETRCIGHAPN